MYEFMKPEAKLLDKKANWETVTLALQAQEEALNGFSTGFSRSLAELVQNWQRVEKDLRYFFMHNIPWKLS